VDESLRSAVQRQAEAHVRGDAAAFASFMTPGALLRLWENGHGHPRRFDVVAVEEGDGIGESAVRYSGRGSYVLRQRWERRDGAWKSIDAERPSSEVKMPMWQRVLRLGRGGARGDRA
jgi:hypothetical protein